ncbi:MAG: hypothetical protein IPH37_16830 [Burkholderiales bacterium]|nr:hypothetical protein [Burkholderiales bacterium]
MDEHHERLNGSGYPARLTGEAISPLDLILAATETTMGIARAHRTALPVPVLRCAWCPASFRRATAAWFSTWPRRQRAVPHQRCAPRSGPGTHQHHPAGRQQTAQALQSPSGSTERPPSSPGAGPHRPLADGLERPGCMGRGPGTAHRARPF